MAQLATVQNFKGLLPPLDRRRVNEPYCVEGMNFVMSVDGPYSGLGRTFIGYLTINNHSNVQAY